MNETTNFLISNNLSIILSIWSILATLISIWQFMDAKKHAERNKAQVKIWMYWTQGMHQALGRIVNDNAQKRYSSTNDMANAVWSLEGIAFSLQRSLFDERIYTESEYKKEQREILDSIKSKNKEISKKQETSQ